MRRVLVLLFVSSFFIFPAKAQVDVGVGAGITLNSDLPSKTAIGFGGELISFPEEDMPHSRYGSQLSIYVTTGEFSNDFAEADFTQLQALVGPSIVVDEQKDARAFVSPQIGFSRTSASVDALKQEASGSDYSPGLGLKVGVLGTETPVFMTFGASYYFTESEFDNIIEAQFALGLSF